jgi:hypothetical protein
MPNSMERATTLYRRAFRSKGIDPNDSLSSIDYVTPAEGCGNKGPEMAREEIGAIKDGCGKT